MAFNTGKLSDNIPRRSIEEIFTYFKGVWIASTPTVKIVETFLSL